MVIGGQTVTRIDFTLVDGQVGDDTGVDGVIVDEGGPSAENDAIPVLGPYGFLLLALLLAAAGALARRRTA